MAENKACTIYFEKDLYKRLVELAKQDDRSLNYLINKISKEYLDKLGK